MRFFALLTFVALTACGTSEDGQEKLEKSKSKGNSADDAPYEPTEGGEPWDGRIVPREDIDVLVEVLPDKSVKFTNKSPGAIWHWGFYDVQVKDPETGEWLSQIGWCGTDATQKKFAEGEVWIVSPRFDFAKSFPTSRVGESFSGGKGKYKSVDFYSEEIPLAE
jgi:hypothetical protein